MVDVIVGIIIVVGMIAALKYIRRGGGGCQHNCSECRHPCRIR